ncbi:MAG TPA: hypothetical protein VHL08_01175 [Dongiaceae bacterium]|nr:hypothetical protein [Dongiaceae bacterium]
MAPASASVVRVRAQEVSAWVRVGGVAEQAVGARALDAAEALAPA